MTSWIAYLYNDENVLLNNSGIQTTSTISYVFGNLQSGDSYYIEITATSNNTLIGTTGKVSFNVIYAQPTIQSDLTAENSNECGIKLQWNVTQIIGQSENTSYILDEKIDATSGRVWFDSGFSIAGDFTYEMWLESVTNQNIDVVADADIIISATAPIDDTVVWIDNSSQVGSQQLTLVNSPNVPTTVNALWLHNINATSQTIMTLNIDLIQPDSSNIAWLDIGGNLDDLTLLNLKEDNEIISLKYFNEAFHLYSGYTLIGTLALTGSSYYIYIQRINGVLSFNGEVTA